MEIRALRDTELEQAWELDRDSFRVPAERREAFLRSSDPERFVGAFEAGRLVAMCAALPFGQFFGGRAVPMGGLASVSVAPHRRGAGLAQRVIAACLEACRERGEAISTLFPALTRLYRGLGWELAGSHVVRRIATRALQGLPPASGVTLRPYTEADAAAQADCYARLAARTDGFLDRPPSWWGLRRESWADRSIFVAEGTAGDLEGYLVYRQLDGEWSQLGGPFQLAVDEIVWNGRDAGLALGGLLGSWASQAGQVIYRSGVEDPLLLLLAEQEGETLAEVRWMTRIVDVEAAVAARGFPAGLGVAAPFELVDERLPANAGSWLLRVEKGRGRLEPGGSGGARLDVGAFSSLFTGFSTCAGLARAGRIVGGSEDDRAALDAAFAGPAPWLLEEF